MTAAALHRMHSLTHSFCCDVVRCTLNAVLRIVCAASHRTTKGEHSEATQLGPYATRSSATCAPSGLRLLISIERGWTENDWEITLGPWYVVVSRLGARRAA